MFGHYFLNKPFALSANRNKTEAVAPTFLV